MKKINFLLSGLLVTSFSYCQNLSLAQPIAPDASGTNTTVTPRGNRFDISGGLSSQNGANLFHSFQKFGLSEGQIANFLSNPAVRNIFGRVTGGDASYINGLIQVTGGNSNLFLMNPAGIVFGANARLNVPADFTATTATGIGFGNHWFQAVGNQNWAQLVGEPSAFAFGGSQPGAIANFGNLTLNPGRNLTLAGGSILNAGSLSSAGGKITLAAVPGSRTVRISQPGHLLSLEVGAGMGGLGEGLGLTPQSLPELLTGSGLSHASQVRVNSNGTIQLVGSQIAVPVAAGDAIASGKIDVSSSSFLGGKVSVLGTRVGLIGANIDASGSNGGGTVLIGGDYKGLGTVPNATFSFVSPDSTIKADALAQGSGGKVIVWADDTTRFYGTISARGGAVAGNGGFVETSGKNNLDVVGASVDASAASGLPGMWLLDPRDVTIQAAATAGGNFSGGNPDIFTPDADSALVSRDNIQSALNGGTSVTITTGNTGAQAGNIEVNAGIQKTAGSEATFTLEAAGNISVNAPIGNSSAAPLNLVFTADTNGNGEGTINIGQSISTGGGSVALTATTTSLAGGIAVNAPINSGGGNITMTGSASSPGGQFPNVGDGITINAAVNSGGGNISLTGTSNFNSNGIFVNAPLASGGGTIELIGSSNGGNGIAIASSVNSGSGDIVLSSDSLNLDAGGAPSIAGTGNLTLQPLTPTLALQIGGAGVANTIFLTDGELSRLTNGFASIAIGRADSSGQITLGNNVTFNDPVILRSPAGSIDTSIGGFTLTGTDNATITLESQSITTGTINSQGQAIRLNSSGTVNTAGGTLNASSVTGNAGDIAIIAAGDIIFGPLNASSTAGNGGAVTLTSTGGSVVHNPFTGSIDTRSTAGSGGAISISAAADISAPELNSSSPAPNGSGGTIALSSSGGTIDTYETLAGGLDSSSASGMAGDVILSAPNLINLFNINAMGLPGSGNITVTSNQLDFADDLANPASVRGSGTLTVQPFTSSQLVQINPLLNEPIEEGNILLVGAEFQAAVQDGFNDVIIGRADATGAIAIDGAATFNDPVAIQTGGTINVNQPISGAGNASLTLNAPLINLNENVATIDQNITLGGNIILGADVTLDTGGAGAGDVIFNGTVDGARALGVNAGTGNVTFNGAVGSSTPLSGLIVSGQTINTAAIRVAGNIDIAASGTLNFGSTVTTSNNGSLAIANTGNLTLLADNLQLDGAFLQTGAGAVSLSGNLNTTDDAIAFNAPVTLAGAANFNAGTAEITFNSTLAAGNNNLALTADTINLNSAVSGTGTLLLQPATPSANIDLPGQFQLGAGLSNLQDGFSSITIGRSDGSGAIAISGNVTFNDPATIQSPSGTITVNGAISGTGNASITLNAATINLNTNIATAEQNIAIAGNTVLGNNVTLDTGAAGGGNILLGGNIDGGNDLTLAAGTGDITVTGAAGSSARLGNFTVNSANNVTAGAIAAASLLQISGSGATLINGAIDTNSAAGINLTGNSFNLNGTVTATNQGGFSVSSTNSLNLANDVNLDGDFTATAAAISLAGNIATPDRITFNSPVTLAGNATLNTSALGGDIAFNSTLDGTQDLTLTAGTGNITLAGAVGSTAALNNLAIESANNLTAGAITAASLVQNSGSGTTIFNGAINTSSAAGINLAGSNFTVNAPVAAASGGMTVNHSGTLNIAAPITLNGAFSQTGAGAVSLGGNISATGGGINFTSPVTLTGAIALNAGGGDIVFNNRLDGAQDLTLNAGSGNIIFNEAIAIRNLAANSSGTTRFNSTVSASTLATDAGGTTEIGGSVTTTGAQQFNDAVRLAGNVTFTSSGGDILFNSTVDGTNGSESLNLNAPAGNIAVNGAIGSLAAIGNLTSASSGTTDFNGNVAAASLTAGGSGTAELNGNIATTGTQQFNSAVRLTGNVALNSGNGDIIFNATLDGTQNLALTAGTGNVTFAGAVGGVSPLGNLAIESANNITAGAITAASLVQNFGSGTTAFNGALNTTSAAGINLTGSNFTFNAPVTTAGGGGVAINNSGTLNSGAAFNLDGAFSQTGAGAVSLGGNIATTGGSINFNSPVTLASGITLNTGAGDIVFNNRLNGAQDLTLSAGSGNITLGGAAGGNVQLGRLTIDSAANVTAAAITADSLLQNSGSGTATFNGAVTINSADGINLTGTNFNFNAPLSITGGGLTVNNSGTLNVAADVNARGAFTQIGGGAVSLAGNLSTNNNDIRFSGAVTLAGAVNFNVGSGAIAFNSSLAAGSNPLTLTASEIDFAGAVTGTSTLALQPTAPEQTIAIGGSGDSGTNVLDLTATDISTLQNGFSSITIGRGDSRGAIALIGSVTFNDPTTLQAPAGSGSITYSGGSIAGTDNATITLLANQNIAAGNIATTGGAINIISLLGSIDTRAGFISGGAIALSANTNISTNNIRGASIALNSANGSITAGNLDTSSNTGNGGAIALNANSNVTAGDINSSTTALQSSGGNITVTSNTGAITTGSANASGTLNGGEIFYNASTQITAGEINTSGATGSGGNVTLDPSGDIQVTWINAQGGTAGGNVDITTGRFFRATGSFTDISGSAASISTAGNSSSGTIIIRHGGNGTTPFIVGDAAINGTAGAINRGTAAESSLTNGTFPYTHTQDGGGIQIISVPEPPAAELPAEVTPTPTPAVTAEIAPAIAPAIAPTPTPVLAVETAPEIAPEIAPTPTPVLAAETAQTPTPTPTPAPAPQNSETNRDRNSGEWRDDTISPEENTFAETGTSEPILLPVLRQEIEKQLDEGLVDEAVPFIDILFAREFQEYFQGTSDCSTMGSSGAAAGEIPPWLSRHAQKSGFLPEESVDSNPSQATCPTTVAASVESGNAGSELTFSTELKTVEAIQAQLQSIQRSTGSNPAILYLLSRKEQLDLVVVPPTGKPIYRSVPDAPKETLLKVAKQFRDRITSPSLRRSNSYKVPARQLYEWTIAPLKAELEERGIDTIAFSMDAEFRSLPIAALYDGEKFLVENYRIGLLPSVNLTDTRYQSVKQTSILAMGASEFQTLPALPGVPKELAAIVRDSASANNKERLTKGIWPGKLFLNQAFTLDNLKSQRRVEPYGIIHLATHADFKPGNPANSYIQLWDTQLRLNQIRQMGWNNPAVELLVLSACRTAIGDKQAEMGFAGLAVAAGVKSALASLWYVSDEGTLALMSEFYRQLQQPDVAVKTEALRRAQVAMIGGQLAEFSEAPLSHPYYWAGFTLIGSPW